MVQFRRFTLQSLLAWKLSRQWLTLAYSSIRNPQFLGHTEDAMCSWWQWSFLWNKKQLSMRYYFPTAADTKTVRCSCMSQRMRDLHLITLNRTLNWAPTRSDLDVRSCSSSLGTPFSPIGSDLVCKLHTKNARFLLLPGLMSICVKLLPLATIYISLSRDGLSISILIWSIISGILRQIYIFGLLKSRARDLYKCSRHVVTTVRQIPEIFWWKHFLMAFILAIKSQQVDKG